MNSCRVFARLFGTLSGGFPFLSADLGSPGRFPEKRIHERTNLGCLVMQHAETDESMCFCLVQRFGSANSQRHRILQFTFRPNCDRYSLLVGTALIGHVA